MSDEYGPDFVPTIGQQAYADQQFARTRDAVAKLVAVARKHQPESDRPLPVFVGLAAADTVVGLSDDDDSALGAACGLVAMAVIEVASLTAERDAMRAVVEAAKAWRVYMGTTTTYGTFRALVAAVDALDGDGHG